MNMDNHDKLNKSNAGCIQKLLWWKPAQNSLPVAFCNETSVHGFKFLGQEKRHISERIFWLIGFLSSLGLAIYLIYVVYDQFQKAPVIVSFQSRSVRIDRIPFPALTLCNMNKFPKSRVLEIEKIAENPKHPDNHKAKKQLIFIRNACNAQDSFAKDFDFAYHRGSSKLIKPRSQPPSKDKPSTSTLAKEPIANDNETVLTEKDHVEMTDFLIQNTLSCKQLIRHCMLGEEPRECDELFKPIITDYGKCCTFNILPLPLLLKNPDNLHKPNASFYENPVLGSNPEQRWPLSEINKWMQWNYDESMHVDRKSFYPWHQARAGLPYGLSILVDPNTQDYFCPSSDSVGTRYLLHSPLEMPHVMEFSSMVHLQKEILIEVHPDVTNADKDVREYELEKRNCYFGNEKQLKFYGPYTGGNCADECMARVLQQKCNCTLFYMPRDDDVAICDTDPSAKDDDCVDDVRFYMQSHMKDECDHCQTLCEDVAYNYETTISGLQPHKWLWGDPNLAEYPNGPPEWANHNMSIIHIFFGQDYTVPKLRKSLYGITDLIANTGGILGLCLGFSILSGVEVVYFFTLRAFWKFCRKRNVAKKQISRQNTAKLQNKQVCRQNANTIQVCPHDIPAFGNGWGNSQGHHFYGQKSFEAQKPGYKPIISQKTIYVHPSINEYHSCYSNYYK